MIRLTLTFVKVKELFVLLPDVWMSITSHKGSLSLFEDVSALLIPVISSTIWGSTALIDDWRTFAIYRSPHKQDTHGYHLIHWIEGSHLILLLTENRCYCFWLWVLKWIEVTPSAKNYMLCKAIFKNIIASDIHHVHHVLLFLKQFQQSKENLILVCILNQSTLLSVFSFEIRKEE